MVELKPRTKDNLTIYPFAKPHEPYSIRDSANIYSVSRREDMTMRIDSKTNIRDRGDKTMAETLTQLKKIVCERYKKDNMNYEEECDFLFLLNTPKEYLVVDQMLDYLKSHSGATAKDALRYFHSIIQPGFPPTMTEEEIEAFMNEE